PPVAAHRGEDEGPGALGLELVHRRPHDDVDVGDPPAPGSDRHGLAPADGKGGRTEGLTDPPGDVGEPGPREFLPDTVHRREGHVRIIRIAPEPVNLLDFAGLCPYLSRHMRVPLRARSVSSLLLLALLLGGCSAGGWFVALFKQRPTPLPPASELYAAGETEMNKKRYEE